ncbi:MAG TPA: 1-(5-phosphoribosyl)-5-[(5-phosphoribosylamino)methylideneamino]imidazole-4-carboxamide isomerase [Firmicutes bacterium]|nr:1-(5-phosphoribosyl)-5-[(5-phosphoribosylamino)methylideneamino]imidazole-4-carboxamide isomerase [Bacillota bacterium]
MTENLRHAGKTAKGLRQSKDDRWTFPQAIDIPDIPEVIPAIDIRGGRCVRLFQGDYNKETVFSDDPVAVASTWVSLGATTIHVVDLDGAACGQPVNLSLVKKMASVKGARVELGGGLRTFDDVSHAFDCGVSTAIIGTAALRDPGLVGRLVERFDDKIAVAIDVRDGQVAVAGWKEDTGRKVADLARALKLLGVSRAIVTDIKRDGAMTGPNLDPALEAVASGLEVTVSGGIARLEHVMEIARRAKVTSGIVGMIIGRALYTGDILLPEAIQAVRDVWLET